MMVNYTERVRRYIPIPVLTYTMFSAILWHFPEIADLRRVPQQHQVKKEEEQQQQQQLDGMGCNCKHVAAISTN